MTEAHDRVRRDAARRLRFEAVVALVYVPLQRYAARRVVQAEVDDVVSDALLVLWRRLEDVPEGAELPWAYGVARRCVANRRRAAQRHDRLVDRLADERPDAGPDERVSDAVDAALAALSDADRELVQLWAWEHLSPKEIATVLGLSANAVSIRLFRAKRRMRAALESGAGRRKSRGASGHEVSESGKEPR